LIGSGEQLIAGCPSDAQRVDDQRERVAMGSAAIAAFV
jgi:hypothetical protein